MSWEKQKWLKNTLNPIKNDKLSVFYISQVTYNPLQQKVYTET